jgi:CheY-like chemotaxis protein
MNHRREVLVVDDDAEFRAVVAEVLRSERCDIREARNGQVALRMARERTPDLILTDLAMPAMNGWELYDALAHDERLSRVPVVIISALASTRRPDGTCALDKPLDVAQLVAVLDSVLPA